MDVSGISGLDMEAWDRWVAYRKAIKKPLKEASLHAAALKLSKFGKDQAECVNQSVSNQWTGLFELKKKRDPSEPPQKTDKQKAADDARFQYQLDGNAKMWSEVRQTPIGKLRFYDALLARLDLRSNDPDLIERVDQMKSDIAKIMHECSVEDIADDPHLLSMVRTLWGESKANKLREINRNRQIAA